MTYLSMFLASCLQLIPWLVMDVLGGFNGLPGLLLACLFSASLRLVFLWFNNTRKI